MSNDSGLMADYFTRDELAAELGMNVRSLERWANLRKGPPRIKVGNRIFYHREAVRAWLARQEVPA